MDNNQAALLIREIHMLNEGMKKIEEALSAIHDLILINAENWSHGG